MPEIIDVSYSCGSQAGYLAGAGVKTIIRYYSRDTGIPKKRLSAQEASLLRLRGCALPSSTRQGMATKSGVSTSRSATQTPLALVSMEQRSSTSRKVT